MTYEIGETELDEEQITNFELECIADEDVLNDALSDKKGEDQAFCDIDEEDDILNPEDMLFGGFDINSTGEEIF